MKKSNSIKLILLTIGIFSTTLVNPQISAAQKLIQQQAKSDLAANNYIKAYKIYEEGNDYYYSQKWL